MSEEFDESDVAIAKFNEEFKAMSNEDLILQGWHWQDEIENLKCCANCQLFDNRRCGSSSPRYYCGEWVFDGYIRSRNKEGKV